MKVTVQVQGLYKHNRMLRARALKVPKGAISIAVGYQGVFYALYVHEIMYHHHDIGKAQYLIDPARSLQPFLPKIIAGVMRKGGDFAKGLLVAGQAIQRESELQVPVDTGFLKSQAFTEREQ